MKTVSVFLAFCAFFFAAKGTPQGFYSSLDGYLNSSGRQYYAVEYLGSSPQDTQPAQDYNLNHGEVDAPNDDDSVDENMQNYGNNGFVEIANDEGSDSSMKPYDDDPASTNGESSILEDVVSPDDVDVDEDTPVIVVEEVPDDKGSENPTSLGTKVNETIASEESTSTGEPMTEEAATEIMIELETYNSSSSTTTDMPDQIIPAFVHPIYRPSSKWPLKKTQLGNSKPKPSKRPIQNPQQDEQPQENPNIRRKPQNTRLKRYRIVKKWRSGPKRKNHFGGHFRSANTDESSFRGGSSSSDSKSCQSCRCGITTTRRIVGGKIAAVNELPWLAMIIYNDTIQCGGTLIDDRHVLTAAHCVRGFDIELFELQFLEYNISNSTESVSVLRQVARMNSLKSYVAKNSENDIAILTLSEPIDFETTTARPICLPPRAMEFIGENGMIAGWGSTADGDTPTNILLKTQVPILSNQQCLLIGMKITNNMVCSGRLLDSAIDECQGESGGPLMVVRNKRHILAGVISWADGCARPLKPGVYTRVKNYLPWINKRTKGSCKCK